MQRGVRLIGPEHDRRVKMSRVVIPVIQRKISFRVENGGLVEVGVEARPNERTEALRQVWQEGRRGFGLLWLHTFSVACRTPSDFNTGRENCADRFWEVQ